MKKIALFALAALCVTAAQAVTINWTATTTTGGDTHQLNWYGAALVSGFDSTKLSNYATGNTTTYPMTTTAEGATVLATSAAKEVTSGSAFSSTLDNVDLSSFVAGAKLTLALYSPGWFNGNKHFQYATFELTQEMLDGDYINITVSEYKIGNPGESIDLSGTATVVPEPTALALLALGVAGLALKRKHA